MSEAVADKQMRDVSTRRPSTRICMSNKVPRAAAPDVATASQEANPSCGLLIALPQTPAQTEPPRAWPRTSLKEAAGAAAKEREVGGLAEVRAGGASAAEASAAAVRAAG